MFDREELSRRDFVKGAAAAGALMVLGRAGEATPLAPHSDRATLFRVVNCPVHDLEMRHRGVDALLKLLADRGQPLYRTALPHPWAGADGLIGHDDVVLVKVNCQWKCRGTTNTDVVRGLIHRLLQHPDGFRGEVVIIENGQGQGAFDGDPRAWNAYAPWPGIDGGVHVNAEEEGVLTIDHLVNTVFADERVSSYLLDPIRATFLAADDHVNDGYRRVADVSYPCFTSAGGNRIELREGTWNGAAYEDRLKLINVPVLKHHDGTGVTGALKHTFGILSMWDGSAGIRHYSQSGSQAGKMWTHVRSPILNIVDGIWVSPGSLEGYPISTTHRANVLLAGTDPVALDYHGSKHILLPLGGAHASQHDPDAFPGLVDHLNGAQQVINAAGGIDGKPTWQGDENIDVLAIEASSQPSPAIRANGAASDVEVPAGTPVSIEAGLVTGAAAGRAADAWLLADTPSGWWSYASGGWQRGLRRFRSGPLADVAGLAILDEPLPPGSYTFYAAVDDNTDGVLDATWWDAVRVRVIG